VDKCSKESGFSGSSWRAGNSIDWNESHITGICGLTGFFAAWAIAVRANMTDKVALVSLFTVLTSLPMVGVCLSVFNVHQNASAGLLSSLAPTNGRRVLIKVVALLATIDLALLTYWLCPEYWKNNYIPVLEMAFHWLGPVLAGSVVYIWWIDRRMQDPHDGLWHFGLAILGKWQQVDSSRLRTYLLGVAVKAFYLPLMASGASRALTNLVLDGVDFSTFGSLFTTLTNCIYSIDLTFGIVGYICTLRVLNAHIRSVESSMKGWVVTLMCYAPFSTFVWSTFLTYKTERDWSTFVTVPAVLYVSWGFVILLLLGVYVWCTVCFGYQFSNLTNRGIIASGPYRLTKHPAYLAKNLAWWMIYVPFITHDSLSENLRGCLALIATNLIYYLRARTEEAHLSKDPAYLEYTKWIEEHGLVPTIRNIVKKLCVR
jgi:protein-S-isoprenylcysteine O-methyltransferase Ste14